jgi:hypothetical protein
VTTTLLAGEAARRLETHLEAQKRAATPEEETLLQALRAFPWRHVKVDMSRTVWRGSTLNAADEAAKAMDARRRATAADVEAPYEDFARKQGWRR